MAPIRNETQHTPVLIQDPVLLRRTEHETQAMINHPPILVSDLVDHVEKLFIGPYLQFKLYRNCMLNNYHLF